VIFPDDSTPGAAPAWLAAAPATSDGAVVDGDGEDAGALATGPVVLSGPADAAASRPEKPVLAAPVLAAPVLVAPVLVEAELGSGSVGGDASKEALSGRGGRAFMRHCLPVVRWPM